MYDPANYEMNQKECQERETVYLPSELIHDVLGDQYPLYAYYAVVAKIPKGMVARIDDVMSCLEKAYGKKCVSVEHIQGEACLELNGECPVWRVVSARGCVLLKGSVDVPRMLKSEGLTIEGNKVIDYKEKLYDFKNVRFVVQKSKKQILEAMNQMAEKVKELQNNK